MAAYLPQPFGLEQGCFFQQELAGFHGPEPGHFIFPHRTGYGSILRKSYGPDLLIVAGELVFLFAGAGFPNQYILNPDAAHPMAIGAESKQVKRSFAVFQSAYFFIEFSSIYA